MLWHWGRAKGSPLAGVGAGGRWACRSSGEHRKEVFLQAGRGQRGHPACCRLVGVSAGMPQCGEHTPLLSQAHSHGPPVSVKDRFKALSSHHAPEAERLPKSHHTCPLPTAQSHPIRYRKPCAGSCWWGGTLTQQHSPVLLHQHSSSPTPCSQRPEC